MTTTPAIVDAHQHLWNLEEVDYPWLTPDLGPLYRTFTADELEPQLSEAKVDSTILVQAADSFEDTDSMLAVGAQKAWVAGVVGWVPLLDPAAASQALEHYARDRLFRGVRHLIHDEADPDWVVQPAVIDSLRLLAERDLTFDLVAVLPRHLEHVPTLSGAVPELRIVIDHLAKPPIKERGWEPWASLFARASECPNVYAKVSGLNTAANLDTWTGEDLRPYVEHAVEVFGADRLMFGSDWPVATLAGDYERVVKESLVALPECDEAERHSILRGTATKFYALEIPEAPSD